MKLSEIKASPYTVTDPKVIDIVLTSLPDYRFHSLCLPYKNLDQKVRSYCESLIEISGDIPFEELDAIFRKMTMSQIVDIITKKCSDDNMNLYLERAKCVPDEVKNEAKLSDKRVDYNPFEKLIESDDNLSLFEYLICALDYL